MQPNNSIIYDIEIMVTNQNVLNTYIRIYLCDTLIHWLSLN